MWGDGYKNGIWAEGEEAVLTFRVVQGQKGWTGEPTDPPIPHTDWEWGKKLPWGLTTGFGYLPTRFLPESSSPPRPSPWGLPGHPLG